MSICIIYVYNVTFITLAGFAHMDHDVIRVGREEEGREGGSVGVEEPA